MEQSPQPLLDARQLAAHLNVSHATVLKWHRQRKIPSKAIGRTVRFDLDAVLKSLDRN